MTKKSDKRDIGGPPKVYIVMHTRQYSDYSKEEYIKGIFYQYGLAAARVAKLAKELNYSREFDKDAYTNFDRNDESMVSIEEWEVEG